MNLLICTQAVDEQDPILGFFVRWVNEFARQAERVTVICLKEGTHTLPENVRVYSLGKTETPKTAWGRAAARTRYAYRFLSLIWKLRKDYDSVFVHMNQIYVVLGGIFWKSWGKKIGLWYSHKSVTASLKIALRLTDVVFTPAEKGFPLPTDKALTTGQGVDTSVFSPADIPSASDGGTFRIVTVGRISPLKDYLTLVDAVEIVVKKYPNICVTALGGPGEKDAAYHANVLQIIREKHLGRYFIFVGPVPNMETVRYLRSSDLFVNMGHTGGMDKAVIEAMACGLLTLTCNEVFKPIIGSYGLVYEKKNAQELADKILGLIGDPETRKRLSTTLRNVAVKDHSLDRLVKKILSAMMRSTPAIPQSHNLLA